MLQKTQKELNDKLRRNIWRSLLIMKTATVSELVGVVSGLTARKAKILLRELETHGYASHNTKRTRPEYFQAIDSPALPAVCARCGRPFDVKACTKKETKRQRDRHTETDTQRETLTLAAPPNPTGLTPAEPAALPEVGMEVHHDAA